jgi:hypothetical protein
MIETFNAGYLRHPLIITLMEQLLQSAKDDNDESRIMLYEIAVSNLFKELQSMDE